MILSDEYFLAWGLYLLAVFGAQLLAWRLTRVIPQADVRVILQLLVLATFITPARLEEGVNYWVPAFIAALIEGLNDGGDAALTRLWSILVTMLVLVLLSFSVKLSKRGARKSTDEATS